MDGRDKLAHFRSPELIETGNSLGFIARLRYPHLIGRAISRCGMVPHIVW